jgi:hypothetical protein
MKESLSAAAILGTIGLITSPADASDGKWFPGSLCHPDGETFTNFHSGGGLFNSIGFEVPDDPTNNTGQYFSCPVVRDIRKAQIDGILFARVHVDDKNPSSDISCTLSSRHKTSSTSAPTTVEFATMASSGVGQQRLEFPALESKARGYYNFLCFVPAVSSEGFSGVWFYEVIEND